MTSATDQRRSRGGMMRCTVRRPQPICDIEAVIADRGDRCGFLRLLLGQQRQNGWEARSQHRFAGAGRAEHQKIVRAGRGDFEGAFDVILAVHIGKIEIIARPLGRAALKFGRDRFLPGQMRAHLEQMHGRNDFDTLDQRRLGGVVSGQDQLALVIARLNRNRQHAIDRPQFPAERKLADAFELQKLGARNLTGSRQNAERDRKIEAPAFLRQIGRRQIDRDALSRKLESRVLNRAAHPVLAFLDRRFRQPDDIQRRQAVRDIDLDHHQRRFDAGAPAAVNDRQSHRADAYALTTLPWTAPAVRARRRVFPRLRGSRGFSPAPAFALQILRG